MCLTGEWSGRDARHLRRRRADDAREQRHDTLEPAHHRDHRVAGRERKRELRLGGIRARRQITPRAAVLRQTKFTFAHVPLDDAQPAAALVHPHQDQKRHTGPDEEGAPLGLFEGQGLLVEMVAEEAEDGGGQQHPQKGDVVFVQTIKEHVILPVAARGRGFRTAPHHATLKIQYAQFG